LWNWTGSETQPFSGTGHGRAIGVITSGPQRYTTVTRGSSSGPVSG